jgi:hypothetical protein
VTSIPLELTPEIEECRARLEADLLDAVATVRLRHAIANARTASHSSTVTPSPLAVLAEVIGALEGGGAWGRGEPAGAPRKLSPRLHEALVIHPREKQERQHQLSSLAGRALHLLQGNETARAIARVTERATPERFPRLCRAATECAAALSIKPPALSVARGDEPLFLLLLDRSPFLCVHESLAKEHGEPALFSPAEMTFALGHCFQQVRGGHAALAQLGPDRLENLLLDEVPFLVRTPIRMATKAVGWTRANEAMKSLGERLPDQSRARRVVSTVGNLLPARDQETVLPEVVHDRVRRFIEGVEWSADRAGLLLCGSPAAACAALLGLCPTLTPRLPELREQGARRLLQNLEIGRGPADRLREVLRFALSREYLAFAAT